MSSSLVLVNENISRLDGIISSSLTPWDFLWVFYAKNSDRLPPKKKGLGVLLLKLMVLPLTMNSSIAHKHASHVISGDERIANSNELNTFVLKSNPCNQT